MLINIDKYKFHNLLEPIFVKTKDVLETMSDDYIFSTILNSNNDQNEEETWYYVQLKEGNVFYKSNNASRQMDDDVDINEKNKSDISWLYVSLFDKTWKPGIKIDPDIEIYFEDIINSAKHLPGLRSIGLHISSPKTYIIPHTDYEETDNFMNIVCIMKSKDAILKIKQEQYPVKENQSFIFDASQEHAVENFKDSIFIALTIRIEKDFVE